MGYLVSPKVKYIVGCQGFVWLWNGKGGLDGVNFVPAVPTQEEPPEEGGYKKKYWNITLDEIKVRSLISEADTRPLGHCISARIFVKENFITFILLWPVH